MTVYNVVVCDDDHSVLQNVSHHLERFSDDCGVAVHTICYDNGKKLLAEYSENTDILFLDIQINEDNGVELARAIREKDKNVYIVFITSHAQYALDGYTVRASGFLVKPVNYSNVFNEVKNAIRITEKRKPAFLQIKNSDGYHQICIDEILYIEVRKHSVDIQTTSGPISLYASLGSIEAQVEKHGFSRCHASYLVNLKKIRHISSSSVVLTEGETIPVSKNKRQKFLNDFAQFAGENI